MTITDELVELTTAEPKRDRWGRPLVLPRAGGKRVAMIRPSSLGDVLDDRHNLEKWMQRQVLLGTLARPDLHALAATSDPTDKAALNRLCDQLRDAAASDAKANMGTAVHAAIEVVNRGGDAPPMFAEHVAAYRTLLASVGAEVDAEHVEQFVVNEIVGAAGTFDMRLRIGGKWYVADLKTGASVEWSGRSFSVQLAVYAGHTSLYDWATDTHADPLEVDQSCGVIVHVPAADPSVAALHWIDLESGREAIDHALWVRDWRKRKGLLTPLELDGGGTDDHSGASAVVEGTVERPSTTSRPRRPVTPPIKPVPAEQVAPRPPSGAAPEGRELRQDEVDKLRETIKAIGDSVQTVTRWKDEATVPDGKAPGPAWGITDSAGRTYRRYALAMTACRLAAFADDDNEKVTDDVARAVIALVIGEDACQSHPVGRLIGVLTVDEAQAVAKVAMTASLRFSEDDRPVIVPAA